MAKEEKPNPRLLGLIANREKMAKRILSRTPKGLISQTSAPTSSPRPQSRMGQRFIKNEPWQCSNEQSRPRNLTSASKDQMGPSKRSNEKFQTNSSSYEVPAEIPDLSPSAVMDQDQMPLSLNPIPTMPRSGSKRKESHDPTDRHNQLVIARLYMKKSPVDNLLCEVCQVVCSGAKTMQQHLNGRPHKAKLEYMRLNRNCSPENKPSCDVCEIWCSDRDALQMHFNGQKHIRKLQELQLSKQNGGEKSSKKPILCELCHVPCMNQDCYKMHLKGRPHAVKEMLKSRGLSL